MPTVLTRYYSLDDTGSTYGGWRTESTVTHPGTSLRGSRDHNGHSASDLISSPFAYPSGDVSYSNNIHSGEILLTQQYPSVPALMDASDMANGAHEQSPMFPFLETEHEHTIHLASGEIIRPTIHAMATKGFFTAQGHWTCYRRNYFALNAWYELGLVPHNSTIFAESRPIKAFAMHLSAAIEGQEGKDVELVQYTPKRDLGLKNPVATTRVPPSQPVMNGNMNASGMFMGIGQPYNRMNNVPGFPYLPLQNERDPEPPESPMSASQESSGSSRGQFSPPPVQSPQEVARHSFDRIQFKGATQNNGKRRASQQFYVLIVELLADVRTDDATRPEWVRVATRPSDKLVVRGRSPSHYKDSDGRVNPRTGRGGSHSGPHRSSPGGGGGSGGVGGGHSGYGGGAGPTYSPGSGNPGAFRPSHSYNSNHSSMSPTSPYATTSPSSVGDAMTDIKHHGDVQQHMSREDLVQMQHYTDFPRFYGSNMFGGGAVGGSDGVNILGKMEGQGPVVSLPGVAAIDRDHKLGSMDDYTNGLSGRRAYGQLGGLMGCDTGHVGWYPGAEFS